MQYYEKSKIHRYLLNILIPGFLFILALPVFSKHYSFKNYTTTDGIGSSSINHIFQDRDGYIWFATQGGGVSRFDGNSFVNFTRNDGLISNDATYINQDKKGNIWIGTATGVSIYNGKEFNSFNKQNGFTDGVVFCIHIDKENTIRFATQDDGLIVYNGSSFKPITTNEGLQSNEIYTVTQRNDEKIWIGTAMGVASILNDKITVYDDTSFQKNAYFSSFSDKEGNIWFGSVGDGLLKISANDSIEKINLPYPVENDFIGGITQDQSGNIWLATDHGIMKYVSGSSLVFGENEGLSVNIAQTVMCDYEGNIWCGTLGGGIDMLSSEAFISFNSSDGLNSKNIICIEPNLDGQSNLLGSSEGLYVFNPSRKPSFNKISGIEDLESANIVDITVDAERRVWICDHNNVLVLEKSDESYQLRKTIKEIAGVTLISPTKIMHDSKGNTWIATFGSGLFKLSDEENGKLLFDEYSFQIDSGFISNKILTLFEDQESNIWVGTHDQGLVKYDGRKFVPISNIDETGQSVWSITEDSKGNIFWSTLEHNLCRYDGKRVHTYSNAENNLSTFNTALLWDKEQSCLWVGSEKGLSQINFNEQYEIQNTHFFTEKNGFKPSGINQNAIVAINKNQLYLGTSNGLWLFNKNKNKKKSTPPKIQLTQLRLFFQSVDWTEYSDSLNGFNQLPENLKLPYNKNHLTFDIQALTTQDIQYSYILKGQDKDWSIPGKNNEITYSNISPGYDYTFIAKAINTDGIESDELVSLNFTVLPPWWQTWWFQTLAGIGFIGIVFSFIKGRERVLKERNRKLELTVEQRTNEIAKQKVIVEQALEEKEELLSQKEVLLKEIHHRVKNNLQTISSLLMLQSADITDDKAKSAIRESQNRVHSIALVHQKLYQNEGIEKVELKNFIDDLCNQIESLYYDMNVEISIQTPLIHVPIDIAVPLGLIFNELLTNSFKYAFDNIEKGEIKIELKPKTSDIKSDSIKSYLISYIDNGPGLKNKEQLNNPNTLGLRLIQLLSKQIGADLEYSNENHSEFMFSFKKV